MTKRQEARLIKKSNRIRQKIIKIELTIKENKLKGLDYRNRELEAEALKLRMENEKHLVLLEAGIIISGSAFKMTLNTGEPEFEKSFIERHAMDALLVVLTLINIYIMMETWK